MNVQEHYDEIAHMKGWLTFNNIPIDIQLFLEDIYLAGIDQGKDEKEQENK